LDLYDQARSLVQNYKHVYEQVKAREGYLQIRCGFYRLINRRYQPMHIWPTFVTARTTEEQQTQIVATLLGIEELENLAMEWRDKHAENNKPFKAVLAEWAWEKHQNPDDPF